VLGPEAALVMPVKTTFVTERMFADLGVEGVDVS
jgi:hypothetical protein